MMIQMRIHLIMVNDRLIDIIIHIIHKKRTSLFLQMIFLRHFFNTRLITIEDDNHRNNSLPK